MFTEIGNTDSKKIKTRNVFFILFGVAVLVFKPNYSGPSGVLVQSYAGNIAVSFAVYFITLYIPIEYKHKRILAAGIALATVELFEVFDGFGIMSNTYDSLDLIANIIGVVIGFTLDTAMAIRQRTAINTQQKNKNDAQLQ